MKHFLIFFILLFSSVTFSQEKYQGLMWEISGNGLTKKSYLYGTMHVSGKIAYHLGEEFFDGLNSVDAIALESNPIIWLDEIVESEYADSYLGYYGIARQTYNGFYKEAFKVEPPKNSELSDALSQDHYLSNWMLYREVRGNADFEEETFLDMFIYQAGSKNDKPVYSLEDFKQTSIFSMKSRIPDIERKETSAWYKELTKEKRYYELLQDYYRDQDLDMLDSLQKEVSSDNHLKYMLYDRNVIMANNIDSIISSGKSLFIGIGAAHLPKKKGVIGLLREKGYTVEPVKPTITDRARKLKEDLSKKKKVLDYTKPYQTELFEFKTPCNIYETPSRSYSRDFFGPELTNGTFYTVKQMSTYSYLKGTEKTNYGKKIDSLLFENIPGKIVAKNPINKNGFDGLEIINKTKTGNYQHYNVIFTPINILIFKMGGKHEFVEQNGKFFFETIKLKPLSQDWQKVSPVKNDFSVEVPSYYHFKNNTKVTALYGHPELEAYDEKNDVYYLVKRNSLHDDSFIEEDEFELKRLIDKFCDELDIDTVYEKEVVKGAKYPEAIGYTKTASDRYLQMKVVIKGGYYYFLVSSSKEKLTNNKFFDSFTLNEFTYQFPFEEKVDSTLNFKVTSNYLSPTTFNQMVDKAYEERRNKNDKEDKDYLRKRDVEKYYSETYEQIEVEFVKFHRYKNVEEIDSLWNREIRYFKENNELAVHSKKYYEKDSYKIAEVVFTDTNSARAIYKKMILDKGVMYTLSSYGDTLSQQSKFIKNFYETFTPYVKDNDVSVLDNKAEMFFKAINGSDSLERERALKSVEDYIVFKDEHASKMIETIKNYSFGAKHLEAKAQLIKDLGKINEDGISSFLLNLYDEKEDTAMYQLAVLKAFANMKTKEATQNILKLLEKDIPLSGNKWGRSSVLSYYFDSLELIEYLFPKILNYSFVEDYKGDIYDLLSTGIDSGLIKKKDYKKHYGQILREAKIELKSQISYEQKEQATDKSNSYYYSSYKNTGNSRLVKYANMLIPYYKKKDVQEFFQKLDRVQDYKVQTDIACKLIANDIPVKIELWEYLAEDVINNSYLYESLEDIKRLDLFPAKYKDQQLLTKSQLYGTNFNFEKDSLEFIEKRQVTTTKGEGYVYFYKSKRQKEDKWSIDYVGLQPLDEAELSTKTAFKNTGVNIQKGKEISEIIDNQIKQIEITGHKRADESEDNGYGGYFGY